MNNTTKDIDEQIISLREDGMIMREIADELSITYHKVRYALRKNKLSQITYELTCKHCGTEFTTEADHAKFCSQSCRSKYNKRNTNQLKECKECGELFNGYTGYGKRYCSTQCKEAEGARQKKERLRNKTIKLYKLKCKYCKLTFLSKSRRMFCGEKCKNKHSYWNVVRPNQLAESNKTCGVCGEKITKHLGANVCSDKCRRARDRKHDRLRDKERYRRVKANGKAEWDISIEGLIKRDNNVCYLCGGECDKADHVINDEGHFITGSSYPSIDHVIPISKGGTHTWDNVKLAHFRCNYLKADNITV